ncbi:MAG: carbohydrate ABC transporter permease [Spirochaetaceae bacterium]|nr:MAG: carbohydrate ABC transporter permease [Spirochaetaceae bacterium]
MNLRPSIMKRSRIDRISWADIVAMIVVLLVVLVPLYFALSSAFKLQRDIFSFVPRILFSPNLRNFDRLTTNWPRYLGSIGTSALVTSISIMFMLLVALPSAYSFSRLPVKGVSLISFVLVALRMFPPIVLTIPLYPLFRNLGLIDTPIGLILLYASVQLPLIVLLLKAFMDTIPRELDEQAWIDGCGRAESFVRVIIPVMMPGIVAGGIIVGTVVWNDFLFAFLFTGIRTKTAPIFIYELLSGVGEGALSDWGQVFAATTLQFVPVLLVIWVFQRRMVSGVTIGAVKG